MEELVLLPLVLNIALDHFFAGVLPHGVHVVAARPEVTSPQHLFDFWVVVEDMLGSQAFDDLDDLGGRKNGNRLEKKMHMVLIRANLDEPEFIALLDGKTDVFECFFHWFCKCFLSIFHRTHQMIEKECFVMALGNMVTHGLILHLRESTPDSQSEELWIQAREGLRLGAFFVGFRKSKIQT
jgi:hypothetical protein